MIREGNAFDILPTLADKSVDTLISCMWPNPRPGDLKKLLRHGRRIARHNVIFETVGNSEYHRLCVLAERFMIDEILWVKHRITNYKWIGRRPGDCVERIMVVRNGRDSFFQDIYTYGTPAHGGTNNPEYSNPDGKRALPQVWHGWYNGGEKKEYGLTDRPQPVWLLEKLLYCYTPPGGSVLEVGAGSGSGWLAAKRLGLKYLGIEFNQVMVDAAFRRVSEHPIEPEQDLASYMTRLATVNNNRYAKTIQRREVA